MPSWVARARTPTPGFVRMTCSSGGLAGGDAERGELAPQVTVQLQQHRAQLICKLDGIQSR